MTVRVDTSKLDALIARLPGETSEIVRKGAHAVMGRAKTKAPVDTGALKSSIETEAHGEYLWWVHDGVEYGVYQELGTARMSAHAFMGPAVEMTRKPYEKMWRDLVE